MPVVNHAIILLSLFISQPTIGLLLSKTNSIFRSRQLQIDNEHFSKRISQRLYLDLSDILDDDSTEFLEALKRQMEGTNILNASPREVTNRIKGFFVNNRRSPEEIVNFKKYIDANKAVMDVVNAVLLVEGCTRVNINVRDIISWASILDAMEKPSPLLSSSMVHRGISCVRKMNSNEFEGQKFLKLLWERTQEAKVVLEESDICPAIYSMQSLNANSPITRNFLKYFADSVSTSKENFPSKTICSAVFGLKKMKSFPEVRYLIAALAKKIQSSEVFYHPVNICIALNGLQGMDDSSPEVRNLLTALMDKAIPADEQGLDRAGDREISMALFGLQRMGTKSTPLLKGGVSTPASEVLKVLKYIGTLLDSYDQPFEGRRLGFAVMGISGLSSEVPEVQRLVGQLAAKAQDAWGDISSQELSMCLHGLASMKSESPNVRSLVKALVPLVKKCPSMTANDVRSAMYGLQGMHSSSKEGNMNDLVEAFGDLYSRSDVHFTTPYDASTALYSMQGLSSSVASSRRLMALISTSMESVKGKYDSRDISMSLYGIKEFSSADPVTLSIISKLSPFIREFEGTFNVQNVAGSLQGLQKMKSGIKEVDDLTAALAPHVGKAQGIFNSKGLSMSLNGLQGLDSKVPDARSLINSLASLIEKSDQQFGGFEDFHQISFTLAGLAGMSSEHIEVRRLVDSIMKLMKPLLNRPQAQALPVPTPPTAPISSSPSTPEVAVVRQWQQGKGVVVLEDSSAANGSTEKKVEKVEKKKEDRLLSMLKDAPKPEKIGMALFGMQGLSSRQDSVRTIMDVLLPFVKKMPATNGKILGMSFQGFKSCTGKPPSSHAAVLTLLSKKIAGYSRKKGGVVGANGKENGIIVAADMSMFEPSGDAQVTFRSALWGVSKMDKESASVRAVLKALAGEALQWDPKSMDKRTFASIAEVFQGGGIEEEDDVSALLAHTAQFMPVRKTMDPSLSKNSSTISTETNNQKNPSSANKNVLKSVNTHVNGGTSAVKKVRDTNGNRNGTTVAKNKPPKNNNSTSTSTSSVKAQPKPQTPKIKKVVVLAEGEEEVPKLSRRLKIQNKLEKRIKAAEEAEEGVDGAVGSVGLPTSPTSTSTSVSMTASEAVSGSPNVQQALKSDNNNKIGRPPGTGSKGSAPAGPNSGRKWVHRSVEVGASAGAGVGASESSSETRQSSIVGSNAESWADGAAATALRIVATGLLDNGNTDIPKEL